MRNGARYYSAHMTCCRRECSIGGGVRLFTKFGDGFRSVTILPVIEISGRNRAKPSGWKSTWKNNPEVVSKYGCTLFLLRSWNRGRSCDMITLVGIDCWKQNMTLHYGTGKQRYARNGKRDRASLRGPYSFCILSYILHSEKETVQKYYPLPITRQVWLLAPFSISRGR